MGAPLSSIGISLPSWRDEYRVIRQTDDTTRHKHLFYRILHDSPGSFVNDMEYLSAGPAFGVLQGPTRELLGHLV